MFIRFAKNKTNDMPNSFFCQSDRATWRDMKKTAGTESMSVPAGFIYECSLEQSDFLVVFFNSIHDRVYTPLLLSEALVVVVAPLCVGLCSCEEFLCLVGIHLEE